MAENDNIHAGHRGRMLDRFGREGIGVFSEHEVLEVLLYFMFARVNTNHIAHNLIRSFGSIKSVLSASVCELKRIDGIGEGAARRLRFFGEFANYLTRSQTAIRESFSSTEDVIGYCLNLFKGKLGEFLSLLLLDERSALKRIYPIINGISVMPEHIAFDFREVVRQAVNYGCSKVIIAQKRNYGRAAPSENDVTVTRELGDILRKINVGIVDHIIVCDGKAVSMRSSGYLHGIWAS